MSEIGLNRFFNVFVSHANEDMETVNKFATILAWNNVNPLVAENFKEPGVLLWKDKIKRLVNESHYFVVLYTYNAQNKVKIHQEIGSAGIRDKRIIVILQQGIEKKDLPGYLEGLEVVENFEPSNPSGAFNNVTCILLNDWYGKTFPRLEQINQFYGYHENHGKIKFKFDDVSEKWTTYRYEQMGSWVMFEY